MHSIGCQYIVSSLTNLGIDMLNMLYNKEIAMDAVSYSDLRQNLKSYLDKVYHDHDPMIIARKNNENLVLISVGEYNSLLETSYLLSSEANAKHLKKSIEQLKSGKISEKDLLSDEYAVHR